MSQENVEVVRRALSAYNRRDLEALRAVNAPDVEVDWSESRGLEAGVYRGQDAAIALYQRFFDAFESIEIDPERFVERADTVLVPNRSHFVGRDGVATTADSTIAFHVQDGRVARIRLHQTMPAVDMEELVRWAYAYFNREHEPPPTWLPDGEFVNAREDPDHATYRGIEAIRKQHQGWFDSYPDLTLEPLEIRVNGDRVFVWVQFSGHGADSGLAMDMELAHVLTRDEEGRTRRLEEFFDRGEALRAAGIEE
jgi:ketosteroid isomerase-like protein